MRSFPSAYVESVIQSQSKSTGSGSLPAVSILSAYLHTPISLHNDSSLPRGEVESSDDIVSEKPALGGQKEAGESQSEGT